jgi:hypothetical protein
MARVEATEVVATGRATNSSNPKPVDGQPNRNRLEQFSRRATRWTLTTRSTDLIGADSSHRPLEPVSRQ